MLYSLFVSPLNLSMVIFLPSILFVYFRFDFSAFCDLRLMNPKIHNRFQHVNVLFLFG